MLNTEYPNFEKKLLDDLELKLSEQIKKINIRGKKKEFFTKVGKILSIILPIEPNTSSSNQLFSTMWLSPDEWLVYFNGEDKQLFKGLFDEISKFNFGSIVDVSDQWICINIKGIKTFDLLSSGSPFNFNNFLLLKINLFIISNPSKPAFKATVGSNCFTLHSNLLKLIFLTTMF